MIKTRLAIIAAILAFAAWHNIESDIVESCSGNQACLAASL
jgi:hypothetical protein